MQYAKAHYRKGLALLGMPDTQQRSKEAVIALKAALSVRHAWPLTLIAQASSPELAPSQCKDVSPDMRKEITEVLKYADERRFDGVDMPENCVIS